MENLRSRLLALRQGLVSKESFLADVSATAVTFLVDEHTAGSKPGHRSRLMTLECKYGTPLVAVFSSADRAYAWARLADGRPVSTVLSSMLDELPAGYGLAVNPFDEGGFELDASDLQALHGSH
jgi:SseB protein N-terminal domain